MKQRQSHKKKPDNTVKVLFWGSIGGLLLRYYWPAIDKWLSEPIFPPQQIYPPVQPVSPQLEVPPLPQVGLSDEGRRKLIDLFGAWPPSDLVSISSELVEYPEPADAALARMVNHPTVILAIGRGAGARPLPSSACKSCCVTWHHLMP